MLDISIKALDKFIKTEKDIEQFLKTPMVITEKLDGVKITVIRTNNKFDPNNVSNNFIFSYKGNRILPEEVEGIDRHKIKTQSIGISQFSFVIDHFKKINSKLNNIPKNTEFFIEFLMNKPTITRNYKYKHSMTLIAYSPTKYTVRYSNVDSKPEGFYQKDIEKYAKQLQLNLPAKLIDGIVYPTRILARSIASKQMLNTFNSFKSNLEASEDNYVKYFQEFKNMLLSVES